jgi:hypothetical protein
MWTICKLTFKQCGTPIAICPPFYAPGGRFDIPPWTPLVVHLWDIEGKAMDPFGLLKQPCTRPQGSTGGDLLQEKFRWTNFVTRNSHQIFPDRFKNTHQIFSARNLSEKSSAPSAPFSLFLIYFLMGPERKKTHQIFPARK